jgi:protease I
MVSWLSLRDDLVNAGATWVDQAVVRDGVTVCPRNTDEVPRPYPALVEHVAAQPARLAAE